MPTDQHPIRVAALYRFTRLADPAALRGVLQALCDEQGIRGTLLLAEEGINGTVAGEPAAIDTLIAAIRRLPGCAAIEPRYSGAPAQPFRRMKVKVKPEIVTMRVAGIDPPRDAGTRVDPIEWNALIEADDVVLIDTRNGFEVAMGSFIGAIDPGTESFADFPGWFDRHANRWRAEGKRLAMFCTGGIRCEKATAYARLQGFETVYHLRGGILAYLEHMPASDSRFNGRCFVFDERVALGSGLEPADDSAPDRQPGRSG